MAKVKKATKKEIEEIKTYLDKNTFVGFLLAQAYVSLEVSNYWLDTFSPFDDANATMLKIYAAQVFLSLLSESKTVSYEKGNLKDP